MDLTYIQESEYTQEELGRECVEHGGCSYSKVVDDLVPDSRRWPGVSCNLKVHCPALPSSTTSTQKLMVVVLR